MTFETEGGFGTDEKGARQLFDRYLEEGGNFLGRADGDTNGKSEEIVSEFVSDHGVRHRVVITTKFAMTRAIPMPVATGARTFIVPWKAFGAA